MEGSPIPHTTFFIIRRSLRAFSAGARSSLSITEFPATLNGKKGLTSDQSCKKIARIRNGISNTVRKDAARKKPLNE